MTRQNLIRIFAVFNILESALPFALLLPYLRGREQGPVLGILYAVFVFLLWSSAYGIWRHRRWGFFLIILQSLADLVYRSPSLIAWFVILSRSKTEVFIFLTIEVVFFCLSAAKVIFFLLGETRKIYFRPVV